MKRVWNVLLILPVLCLVFAACGGSAIGDAQEFSPNEPPVILSIKAVNLDGSEITQLDIEPYKQFKLIVEATDPDNNPLEYKFDSASGTFAGISGNSSGCTAIFKTGSVKGGQNIELWAGVSDGKGAIVRQSYNLGTGKLGPAITAILDKTIIKPNESIKLSVTANCSGFFQMYSDGTGNEDFKFENDMFRYSYSENKTTDFILGGPEYNATPHDDIHLAPKAPYLNSTSYKFVIVFRDGLLQTSRFKQTIYVDEQKPEIELNGFSPITNVNLTETFEVTFSENIGYADSSCLKLDKAGSVKLVSISGSKAYFSVSGLKSLQKYTATISGIKDIAGNEMLPDSTKSFTTKYGGSSKFAVWNAVHGTAYTSYCGFENNEFQLQAQYEGNMITEFTNFVFTSSDLSKVSISTTGLININTKNLINVDETIKITAEYLGEKAEFIVNIKPWYIVKTQDDFQFIRYNLHGRFELGNNIELSGNFLPIGTFYGFIEGNENVISNLSINANVDNVGFVSQNCGTIQNIIFKNPNVDSTASTVGVVVGNNMVMGGNKGLLINCETIDAIISGKQFCGGIAGYNAGGIIQSCKSSGSVTSAYGCAGGIVGKMTGGTVKNCDSNATIKVTITDDSCVGGIIGSVEITQTGSHEITNCHYTGVSVIGKNYVGGLIGSVNNSKASAYLTIDNCSTEGDVYVEGTSNVGGLIGYAYGKSSGSLKITNSKVILNETNLNADIKGNKYVGGLIGYVECDADDAVIINKSYAIGNISCMSNKMEERYAGGLIGTFKGFNGNLNTTDISECFSKGTVHSQQGYAGGLVGDMGCCYIINCYSKSEVSGPYYIGGLVGNMGLSNVQISYAAGSVLYATSYWGGLYGNVDGSPPSFSDSLHSTTNGTNYGVRVSDLTDSQNYTNNGWSFGLIWLISSSSNGGFPYLASIPPNAQ